MKSYKVTLAAVLLVAGCTTPPALQLTAQDRQAENSRTTMAKLLLQRPTFGSVSLVKAKIINAKISRPAAAKALLSGEPYTRYCVHAQIENPLFPIHKSVYASVEVTEEGGIPKYGISASEMTACSGSDFEPFPELEELSVKRYSDAS